MDTNEVAVVDFTARKVVAHWRVAPGGLPVGMSIDTKNRRLFIGCRGPQKLIVMSTADGKVLAFASTAGGALSVASETSPGTFAIVQTVKTGQGARTMGIDPTSHRIYLPAAEFEEPKSGGAGRPVPKPGTFMILVVARPTPR
jgi:hypothetical protein